MSDLFASSPEFIRLVRGDEHVDLARVSLELARDRYPHLAFAPYEARLDAWAERVRGRCVDGVGARHLLLQINRVLFEEEHLRGNSDDYYDPRNSYLNQVIDRGLGIPISLSVVYMAVAARVGLEMAGVNLPGHFVIRVGLGQSTIFVDPFHQGALLDRAGCEGRVREVTGQDVSPLDVQLAPCAASVLVVRMLRNLKAAYLQRSEYEHSLAVMRRLVLLTRGEVLERRDLGVACMSANQVGEAIDHLGAYLSAHPTAPDASDVSALLREARHRIAALN